MLHKVLFHVRNKTSENILWNDEKFIEIAWIILKSYSIFFHAGLFGYPYFWLVQIF